ncbi:MAG: hypothetical protein K0U54_11110 [Bacteroidetes bacterium]|nr:hypothetical protein [Bacteroidota bacterium]
MWPKFGFLVCLCVSLVGNAQNRIFPKEIIQDSVAVVGSNETYALYLPKSYSVNELSSVLFIFEPMARGSLGVSVFQEAADTFGYILICSNDTKNFNSDNLDVVNRLLNSVFETFSIDEKRIYTTGFSGGSRLATTVAVLTNAVEGVVGCGAGFSPNANHTPNPAHQFSYVGLVGSKDMNYHEMFNASTFLDKMDIENELFTNDEPHKWPDQGQIMKAMTWIELQAYKKNRKKKDFDFLERTYVNWYDMANNLEASNRLVNAVLAYERVERNFSRYYNLDSVSRKITGIKNRPLYNKQAKRQSQTQRKEIEVKEHFFVQFRKELKKNRLPKNFDWWDKELKEFHLNYVNALDVESKGIGDRVKNMLYAAAIETAQVQSQSKNMVKVIYCHLILTKLYPERPFSYCLLANDYALIGDKPSMLQYMELAIEKGLKSDSYFRNTSSFVNYMGDAEVEDVLKELSQ